MSRSNILENYLVTADVTKCYHYLLPGAESQLEHATYFRMNKLFPISLPIHDNICRVGPKVYWLNDV